MRRIRRRRFLFAAGALVAAPLARAQGPAKLPTLGFLSFESPVPPERIARSPFTAKLESLGWVEGRTFRVERVFASGQLDRLPELAADLVRKRVDVIWAVSPPAAVAAARATRTIPIVFARVVWPVELGLARSFARPGGNVTGVASIADPGILAKPIEYLREIAPGARRILMINPGSFTYKTVSGGEFSPKADPIFFRQFDDVGFKVMRLYVESVEDIDRAFDDALDLQVEALFVTSSPLLVSQTKRIVEFALRHRLPSAFIESPFVEAGGLLSYGSNIWGTILQSLDYVDKILRGARPAELPIQLPTQMELAVNLKTAKLVGLDVPQSILLRADRVIE